MTDIQLKMKHCVTRCDDAGRGVARTSTPTTAIGSAGASGQQLHVQ